MRRRQVLSLCLSLAALSSTRDLLAQAPAPVVHHVEHFANSHNPELLYWFINGSEARTDAWKAHLQRAVDNGSFDFIFLTARGANFYDFKTMHPYFKKLVDGAHAHHIKVGLQLWVQADHVPDDQCQAMVDDSEVRIDGKGHAEFSSTSEGVRSRIDNGVLVYSHPALRSTVIGAYAFTKTGDGTYAPGSLVDVTSRLQTSNTRPETLAGTLDDPSLAGKTLFVMTAHYHRYPDMFSTAMQKSFGDALAAYHDIGFDGSALDEFRYMEAYKAKDKPFRSRIYSPAMAAYYAKEVGRPLDPDMFAMRYAPKGQVALRDAALNHYFQVVQEGNLHMEQWFQDETNRQFGEQSFHGIHDTFHDRFQSIEIWTTGINWWTVPRDYAQSDEAGTCFVVRMGMALARPQAVEYNQWYSGDLATLLAKPMPEAAFNTRVHWHAMNDNDPGRLDVTAPKPLAGITLIESKMRLLNAFNAPRPQFNVLFLFGFPSLLNWVQPEGKRSDFDINEGIDIEKRATAAWDGGYRGPLAPTSLLEDGTITVDDHGSMTLGGEHFKAVVYMGPEFSKTGVTEKFQKFVAGGGGKLLIDGKQTMDFDGQDASAAFKRLAAHAVVRDFTPESLERLGVPKIAIDQGSLFTDGSVVLTDNDSLFQAKPRPFSITSNGHTFTGRYEGLVALKTDAQGVVEKLAAGGLDQVERDGRPWLTVDTPSDIVVLRQPSGSYDITVVGQGNPMLH